MSKLPLVMRIAGGFSLLWAMFFLFTPMSALESWLVDSSLANDAGASAIRNAGFAFMCIGFMHIALTMEQFGTENLGTWAMASGALWIVGALIQVNDIFIAEIGHQEASNVVGLALNSIIGGVLIYLGMQESSEEASA